MSMRAMFVGNAPARAGAAVVKKEIAGLVATQRAEQELVKAMLGEELPEPPPAGPPAHSGKPSSDYRSSHL